ncbi:DUF3604 domain-containing protein [Lysobacter aestuarii]|uniref:DUF3604 domain-containing protein n=1 Tax=Marilutibacter aestuarii TaxID=1706195 RepID=A0A508A0P8_9GAMM|nr:DUF3604 domain-containing protein [Lysobacter aestuarii]
MSRRSLRQGRSDGRDLAATYGRRCTHRRRCRVEGPGRCQPGPHPDRQGLGSGWRGTRPLLRRRVVGWPRRRSGYRKAPAVGSTVDGGTASYTNEIGAAELSAVWRDPDFDPSIRASYCVRVLEFPTPRWSTYDAARLGIEPRGDVETIIQERAWPSPIWYDPARME